MATDPTGTPPFDPDDPVAEFVYGVAAIFFNSQNQDPVLIKPRIQAILERRPAPPVPVGLTRQAHAEALVEAAWESPDTGAELAIDALRVWPDCAHAYVYLGADAGEHLELALALYTLGITAGFDALGEAFFARHAGDFWGLPESRPFMRALEGAAHTYWAMDATEVAAAHFGQLVELNPNDDQGARYPLLACYLELQEADAARTLLSAYERDQSLIWAYGEALTAFQESGESPAAAAALERARAVSVRVAGYLSELEPLPEGLDSPEDPRFDDVQAAQWLSTAWRETPGALEWLRRAVSGAAPAGPPAKEKRSGPRQI